MTLEIYEWPFRNKRLEACYTERPRPAGMAIQAGLAPSARRARELEARGYYRRPLSFKRREKLCYAATSAREVDPDAVRALKHDIEREEPGWVERVRAEWETYRDVESVSFWAEVPIQAVVAILESLNERGELSATDLYP